MLPWLIVGRAGYMRRVFGVELRGGQDECYCTEREGKERKKESRVNYYFFISIVVALLTDTLSGFSLLSDPAPWKKKKKGK